LAKLSQLNLLPFLTPYLLYIKMEGYQPFMSILTSHLFIQVFYRSTWPITNEFLATLLCNMTLQFLAINLKSLWSARWWLLYFLTHANIQIFKLFLQSVQLLLPFYPSSSCSSSLWFNTLYSFPRVRKYTCNSYTNRSENVISCTLFVCSSRPTGYHARMLIYS